jgi:hypothetical protein
MPALFQSSFTKFHEAVKLVDTDENSTLREKRDGVLKRMRDKGLVFDPFNQGSYEMGTGIKPLDTDYDIDVGVIFTGDARPANPLDQKKKVYDALFGYTSDVGWRRNCIRVQYVKAGEPRYHVDLAVYWKDKWSGTLALAVGKQGSAADQREWLDSDPKGLTKRVNEYRSGEDRAQFKRTIRYLKRWKDLHFPSTGYAKPVGIGFTVAALEWFQPRKAAADPFAMTSAGYDDLRATKDFVDTMRANFISTVHDGEVAARLQVKLVVAPLRDVFARMTNQQMKEFKGRLDTLSAALQQATMTGDSKHLRSVFGTDFPA